MADTPYRGWPTAALYTEQQEQIAVAKMAKEALADLQEELRHRHLEGLKVALLRKTPDGAGTFTMAVGDGFLVKGEAKRDVKWDSAHLLSVAMSMTRDECEPFFKIEVSIPEAAWKNIPTGLRTRVIDARTVKVGEPKIVIEKTT